jgi:hypothetical protein
MELSWLAQTWRQQDVGGDLRCQSRRGFLLRRISALVCRRGNLHADELVFSMSQIAQGRRNTMRDFNFDNDGLNADTGAANTVGVRPIENPPLMETPPEILKIEEPMKSDELPFEDSSSLRPFHAEAANEESGNLPKVVGAVVVGLLIVGGGIYAYERSAGTPVKTAAVMKTPAAPANMAASAPSQPSDITPPSATPQPAPPVKSASEAPLPAPIATPAAPQQTAKAVTPGVGIGPSNDPAIDAPMTFTADNAPAPQQPGSSVQTATAKPSSGQTMALQQPITPPNVGNTQQPTASVANNQPSGVTLPSQTPSTTQMAPRQIQPTIQPPPAQ